MDTESFKLIGLQMEYSHLRNQFLKRIEMRHQVIELNLTIAGAFLGVALTKGVPPSIALVFPPIATLLSIEWIYIDTRQTQTIQYLLDLEKKIPELELGWEKSKVAQGGFNHAIMSHGGVFLFTQIMALIIGNLVYDTEINNWTFRYPSTFAIRLLLLIGVVCFIITLIKLWLQTKEPIIHR